MLKSKWLKTGVLTLASMMFLAACGDMGETPPAEDPGMEEPVDDPMMDDTTDMPMDEDTSEDGAGGGDNDPANNPD